MIGSLKSDPDIGVVIYPKEIDVFQVKETIIDDYSEITGTLRKKVGVIRNGQIVSNLTGNNEIRTLLGKPPISARDEKNLRGEIVDKIVDRMILGLEGLRNKLLTKEAFEIELLRYQRSFEDQSAFRQGILDIYGSEESFRRWFRIESARERYLLFLKTYKVEVDDSKVKKYYYQNRRFFEEPERIEVAQIFFRISSTATDAEIQSRENFANSVRNKLFKGKKFKDLVRKYTEDGNGEKDGYLGFFKRGELGQKTETELFSLGAGRISSVIKSSHGFHIYRILNHYSYQVRDLEEVKELIRDRLKEKELVNYLSKSLPLMKSNYVIHKKV